MNNEQIYYCIPGLLLLFCVVHIVCYLLQTVATKNKLILVLQLIWETLGVGLKLLQLCGELQEKIYVITKNQQQLNDT